MSPLTLSLLLRISCKTCENRPGGRSNKRSIRRRYTCEPAFLSIIANVLDCLLIASMTGTKTQLLEGYLRPEEMAKQIGVSPRTLSRWQVRRIGPPRIKIGKTIFYRTSAVLAWLESREKIAPASSRSRYGSSSNPCGQPDFHELPPTGRFHTATYDCDAPLAKPAKTGAWLISNQ